MLTIFPCIQASAHLLTLLYYEQNYITAIATWVEGDRHLKLHIDKCHLMLISRKCIHSVTPPPLFIEPTKMIRKLCGYVSLTSFVELVWVGMIVCLCRDSLISVN